MKAVDGVDLSVGRGEVLGLVGESGSGKSVSMYSLLQLVSEPGRVVGGTVRFEGIDLLTLPRKKLRDMCCEKISMIFQQPNSSLNPCYDAGFQIGEVYEIHRKTRRKVSRQASGRDAQEGPHPRCRAAGDELPTPVVGWTGPTGDDRHGPRRRRRNC